jgi:hypothetical protein
MALTKVTSPMIKGQTLTYRIPTDFPSLQAAVDALLPTVLGDVITLNIETGHKLTSGLIVENGDYTQFTITSTDATVLLSASWVAGTALLTGTNARMPNWNIFVDCEGKNVNTAADTGAINVLENSTLLLGDGAGCTNGAAGNNGLFVYRNSKVTGNACIFTDFPNNNVWITHLSTGYLERVTATGAGLYGMFVSRSSVGYASGGDFSNAGTYGVAVWRSRLTAIPAGNTPSKFNNCGNSSIYADTCGIVAVAYRGGIRPQMYDSPFGIRCENGSFVDGRGIDFKNNSSAAVLVVNGTVDVSSAIFSNIGQDVINASACSTVSASSINANGAASRNVIRAIQNSRISAPDALMNGAGGDTVFSTTGSVVEVSRCTANNAGQNAFYADGGEIVAIAGSATGAAQRGALVINGGRINVTNTNLSGCTVGGLRATTGSTISANGVNAQSGGSPATSDVQIQTGSIISFNGGTGGVNATVNTLTGSGIIFQ